MSYLSIALTRAAETARKNQTDIANLSGVSRSFISRLMSGDAPECSDQNFVALLKAFAASPRTQAELVAARCMDARVGPGSELVEISIKKAAHPSTLDPRPSNPFPHVELSHETERAFTWLRSQCPLNADLEKHLVGYARLTGMK